MVEKRKKRKGHELSNPARKKIRVQNQSQIQVPSSPPPSLSPSSPPCPSSLPSSFHIQKEFRRKGITPFIDNEIRRGESIGPEL
ncbi:unnamed protein product, partial [Brassica oleracea]